MHSGGGVESGFGGGGGVLNGVISESDTASGVYVQDNVWNTVLITMSQ